MPQNYTHKKKKYKGGYKFMKSKEKINYLMYVYG